MSSCSGLYSQVCFIKAYNSHLTAFSRKTTREGAICIICLHMWLMRILPAHISPTKHASKIRKFAAQVQTGDMKDKPIRLYSATYNNKSSKNRYCREGLGRTDSSLKTAVVFSPPMKTLKVVRDRVCMSLQPFCGWKSLQQPLADASSWLAVIHNMHINSMTKSKKKKRVTTVKKDPI